MEEARLEARFEWLQNALLRSGVGFNPKIQRIAHRLVADDGMRYDKYFSPKLISLGPIHYGVPKLRLGEEFKEMWASMFLDSTDQVPQLLYKKIAENVEDLKLLFEPDLFTDDRLMQAYGLKDFKKIDESISWMLFVDGCALLQILQHGELETPEKVNVKFEELILVFHDVLLLENQLPYPLLKLLWKETEDELMSMMKNFKGYHWSTTEREQEIQFVPTHLLDLHRSVFLYDSSLKDTCYYNVKEDSMKTFRNIMELKAAGIELKSSKRAWPSDISFSLGRFRSELTLPEIILDDASVIFLLNTIAYEMCPDFGNDYGVSDYISFLNSLIDSPDDVKALRSARILLNTPGSNQDVFNIFTTISSSVVPSLWKYDHVMNEIEKHYTHKSLPTWVSLAYSTYFSNPWAIIAFFAAFFGLALTFIQTWYTVYPPK
ncbi:hypothetical protein VNO80_14507 [Phaseolus coccineus]|uniref:Uncharacterized protein n=1 Tax=Phaseolus coccineus TaxID=3886 RepID=A0AAN9MJV2_PHACN